MLNQCIRSWRTHQPPNPALSGERKKKGAINIFDIYVMQSEDKVTATRQRKEKLKL